jgi:hypothetical protein
MDFSLSLRKKRRNSSGGSSSRLVKPRIVALVNHTVGGNLYIDER